MYVYGIEHNNKPNKRPMIRIGRWAHKHIQRWSGLDISNKKMKIKSATDVADKRKGKENEAERMKWRIRSKNGKKTEMEWKGKKSWERERENRNALKWQITHIKELKSYTCAVHCDMANWISMLGIGFVTRQPIAQKYLGLNLRKSIQIRFGIALCCVVCVCLHVSTNDTFFSPLFFFSLCHAQIQCAVYIHIRCVYIDIHTPWSSPNAHLPGFVWSTLLIARSLVCDACKCQLMSCKHSHFLFVVRSVLLFSTIFTFTASFAVTCCS